MLSLGLLLANIALQTCREFVHYLNKIILIKNRQQKKKKKKIDLSLIIYTHVQIIYPKQ